LITRDTLCVEQSNQGRALVAENAPRVQAAAAVSQHIHAFPHTGGVYDDRPARKMVTGDGNDDAAGAEETTVNYLHRMNDQTQN
jgi:hypothetical protein